MLLLLKHFASALQCLLLGACDVAGDGCTKVAFQGGQWERQTDASIKRQYSARVGVTETFLFCNELVISFLQ